MRRGEVRIEGRLAGQLQHDENGYRFTYDAEYVLDSESHAVSLSLPKRLEPFLSQSLFPFFYGLLAEGTAKILQCRALGLDEDDHFGRLLATTDSDVIGNVTIHDLSET